MDADPINIADRAAHVTGSAMDHIRAVITDPIGTPITGMAALPAPGAARGGTVVTPPTMVVCPMAAGNDEASRAAQADQI